MGGRGTEVARAAASLVLLNDDFASLVGAVRLGRRIYDNIRHAMSFIIAVHIPIAGLGLLPVLFGWPLLLFPLHVMFLEFVVDPACSFVFEADAEAADVMRRKPRPTHSGLFTRRIVIVSVLRGLVALAFDVAVYVFALRYLPEDQARALAFMALVVGSVVLIFVSRTPGETSGRMLTWPNKLFWWISGLTLLVLPLTVYLSPVARLFQFNAPPVIAAVIVVLIGMLLVVTSLLRGRRTIPARGHD